MNNVVIGYKGEVGRAIWVMLEGCLGIDKGDDLPKEEIEFMHVCIPYSGAFIRVIEDYAETLKPNFIIIHSTVPVGTTTKISKILDRQVFHSPVRGKHPHMVKDLMRYVKFYAPYHPDINKHLEDYGFRVEAMERPEETELCKLNNTSVLYKGMIESTEEAYQNCVRYGVPWECMIRFIQTTNEFTPRPLLRPLRGEPIGGHCVMENYKLLYGDKK